MKSFVVRGVPMAMQRDGWWLASKAPSKNSTPLADQRVWARPALLVVLIALGDFLLWHVAPGVSLAVFAVALVMAALGVAQPNISPRRLVGVSMGTLLAVLPVVELVQPLSLLILVVGTSVVFALIAGLPLTAIAFGTVRFWGTGTTQALRDAVQGLQNLRAPEWSAKHRTALMLGWALPVAFGLVFLLLFLRANPLLLEAFSALSPAQFLDFNPLRWALWGGLAVVIWPCLILWRLKERLRKDLGSAAPLKLAIVNHQAVLRSLLIFNVMFAAQTLTDVVVLAGGALPEGMSYANYAHRGAYPLVVTALLAGVFSLIARPFAKEAPLVRILLLVWIVQTVALVIGSVVRLDAYVEVYGLTRLRMAAFIWMALVAAGLCVTWVQVWQDRSAGWMLIRVGALGAGVLYCCAFVSFDQSIAKYNLTHEVRVDRPYLCGLGEAAVPVIAGHTGAGSSRRFCSGYVGVPPAVSQPEDLREWGFRNWRVRRTMAALNREGVQP